MRQSKKIHGPDVRLSSKLFYAKIKALSLEDGDCWIWQGHTVSEGIPVVNFAGVQEPVRRMIRRAEGKTIYKGYSASTTCGNVACVNPDHVQIMTVSQRTKRAAKKVNQKLKGYRLSKAVQHRFAKLTEEQVRQIRMSAETHTALSKVYPVSIEQIRRIRSGEVWAHVKTWGML